MLKIINKFISKFFPNHLEKKIQKKFQQALSFHQAEQLAEAQSLYLKILKINPKHANSLHFLGVISHQTGDSKLAVDLISEAIAINPNSAAFYSNLGVALMNLKYLEPALVAYDKAIALNSNNADFHYNRGNILRELRQLNSTLVSYDKAIELNSNNAEYYHNRGNVLRDLKHLDSAVSDYEKAIQLNPDHETYFNCGNVLCELGRLDAAIINYDKAVELDSNHDFLLGAMLFAKSKICDWNSCDKNKTELENRIKEREKVSQPLIVLALTDYPAIQQLASEIYVQFNSSSQNIINPLAKRPRSKKIRIGYYSADFHHHATSYLMAGLFESHDKSKFEIIAFSFGSNKDEMQNRVSASFDKFIDVSARSDSEIVALSRELEIDIAIDLKGFTQDMRLGIFAQRAAPIQVNYLGYPGTMSASYIDYIIADKILIPEENKKFYSEKIVYLPNSYQANDDKRKISDKIFTRKEVGLPEKGFVYCCFNNNYKITPQIFDSWMEILKAVEDSVLWLFEDNSFAVQNLQKEAEKRGVDSKRLIFAKRMSTEDHLARQKLADLFLDTLPCNAHTTCSDALWAGLPVLTLIGQSFASRVAASLLNAVNLPELITTTQEEYKNLAIELATNPEKLKEIKLELEKNRLTTPLFNTKIFTNHIESAYEAMYNRYQNDLSPDHIEVSANNYN